MIGSGTAGGGAGHEAFPRGPAKGQEPLANNSLQTAQLSLPRKCHFDAIKKGTALARTRGGAGLFNDWWLLV